MFVFDKLDSAKLAFEREQTDVKSESAFTRRGTLDSGSGT